MAGAFVVPFLVMVVLVGMPLLLLELGLGQKLRLGAAAAWPKVCTLGYKEFDLFLENEEHRPFDGCKIEI